ncbi:hypothetical protein BGY98DRAFT_932349 [Russula aff. rugulosa BPL654]|nr:hypothetical protein BGY98DRAFT_932349 [Russula aff. rugulosa BPL654]
MPKLPSVFRKKRDHKLPINSSSDHLGDASTRQCTLQVTPGGTPSWATQPWHYVFQDGDEAWALGVNGRWRLVRVIGDGFLDNIENRKQLTYNATWTNNGDTMRGTFAPGCGNIKPNTHVVRRLLFDEGPCRVERREWEEVENDYDDYYDSEAESERCTESERDQQALVSSE